MQHNDVPVLTRASQLQSFFWIKHRISHADCTCLLSWKAFKCPEVMCARSKEHPVFTSVRNPGLLDSFSIFRTDYRDSDLEVSGVYYLLFTLSLKMHLHDVRLKMLFKLGKLGYV